MAFKSYRSTYLFGQCSNMMDEKDWNINTLMKFLDERDKRYEQRFVAQQEATHAALIAAEKAVTKAETAAEKRLDSVNEFRGQLRDQAATFIPRSEVQIMINNLTTKINDLEAFQDKNIGSSLQHSRTQMQNNWFIGTIIGIIGLALAYYLK